MSYSHVFPDPDGWCWTSRMSEGPNPGDGTPVSPDECLAVLDCPGLFHHRDGVLSAPQDDRRAWREHLVCCAPEDMEARFAVFRDRRRAVRADLPADVPVRTRPSAAPDFPGLPWSPAEVPDLVVRAFTVDDLDALSSEAIRLGWEPARCPDPNACCQPPEAHTWLNFAREINRPNTWAFAVEWRGQPIQFEMMDQGPPPVSTRTYHLTRERSHWFWRECWRPIADGLRRLGFASCQGLIRQGLDYWVESLKFHYAGRVVGTRPGGGFRLEYDLTAIPFTGWPARRTAGPGWAWTRGPVTIRELADDEMPWLISELNRLWGTGHPRLPTILRLLDEQWTLDRASVLLAEAQGRLIHAFAYRPRRPTVANALTLAPVTDPREDLRIRLVSQGVQLWCRTVGYERLTAFVPASLYRHPFFVQRYGQHAGYQVVAVHNFGGPELFVEIAVDLRMTATRSDAEWAAWTEPAPLPSLEALRR